MPLLARARNLFRNLLRKRQVEDELADELRAFVALNAGRRMSHSGEALEANRAALVELGGVEQIKEQIRDVRVGSNIDAFLQDIRYGVRSIRRSPGFSVTVVLVLALGMGANSAIFSVVDAVLLRALPYRDPDRLVMLWEKNPTFGASIGERLPVAYVNFIEWVKRSTQFEAIGGFEDANFNLTGTGEPERLAAARVTPNLFSVLGVTQPIGAAFDFVGNNPGENHAVILGDSFFRTHFAGDKSVLGRTLIMDEVVYTVVGVLPPTFHLPATREGTEQRKPDVWVPYDVVATQNVAEINRRKMQVFGRLRDGVTLAQAKAELTSIAVKLAVENPDQDAGFSANLFPVYVEDVGKEMRRNLLVLLGAVGFVLLIACANISNLMLTRATSRQKEMALRKALGASAWRLVSRLLAETLLLSTAGAIIGLLIAHFGIRAIVALQPAGINRPEEIHLGLPVFAFTALISVCCGVLFGIIPALQAAGSDVNALLNQTRGSHASSARGTRQVLVISEVALACVLLVGASFMIKSLLAVLQVDPGFRADHLLTVKFSLPASRYGGNEKTAAFCRNLLDKVSSLSGVKAASFSDGLPLTRIRLMKFTAEGQQKPSPGSEPTADLRGIFNPAYFDALGIRLVSGRNFTTEELENNRPVVVINQTLAKRLWPNADPVGQPICGVPSKTIPNPPIYTVIGLVGDTRQESLESGTRPEISKAMGDYTQLTLAVRTTGDPEGMVASVKGQVWAVDHDLPVYEVKTMRQVLDSGASERRFQSILMSLFASLALALSGIGLYGVLSSLVSQRKHEIGVRMALGAQSKDVMRLIVGEGFFMSAIGLLLGVAGGIALSRYLQSLFFGVSVGSIVTYVQVILLMVVITALACALPARKAIRVDPIRALRYE